jgi:hypothetical protein
MGELPLFLRHVTSLPSCVSVEIGLRSATRGSRADEGVRPTLAELSTAKNILE